MTYRAAMAELDRPTQPRPPSNGVFGWPHFALIPGQPLQLDPAFDTKVPPPAGDRFCFHFATSQENKGDYTVRLLDVDSGQTFGEARVWCSFSAQPFIIPISAESAARITQAGASLLAESDQGPLWILGEPHISVPDSADNRGDPMPRLWSPALECIEPKDEPAPERAKRWLVEGGALQAFGWRSGCVLDALLPWAEPETEAAVDRQLAQFVDECGEPDFDHWDNSRRRPDQLGAESGLPIAAFAHRDPNHPMVDWAEQQWCSGLDAEGVYTDANSTAAEGAYMTAFPMAVVGRLRYNPKMLDLAMNQLQGRAKRLWDGQDLWLRHHPTHGRSLPSWARGVAWHVLGLAKTLGELPADRVPESLRQHAREVLAWAFSHRRPDGLWPNLFRQPNSAPDTSGSAGITAAALLAAQQGWGDRALVQPALQSLHTLHEWIDPRGRLHGCAQDNMIGDPLLRSDYRVIHPAGTGLYLTAHLASIPTAPPSELAS